MTPDDLRAWRAEMEISSQAKAAALLGMSRSRYADFERGIDSRTGKPISVLSPALAYQCAALLFDLKPYPECKAAGTRSSISVQKTPPG